jgi:hypothetical protein
MLQMSVFSSYFWFSIISGARYSGVPQIWSLEGEVFSMLEPKSASLTPASKRRMFSGLMSLWMTGVGFVWR